MNRNLKRRWFAAALVWIYAGSAGAVSTVSTNTVSGFWNDAARWTAGIPSSAVQAVLAASENAVATKIQNFSAEATFLTLSNVNMNASVQILNGGSLTLFGTNQIAGSGGIGGGGSAPSGSVLIAQTNAALAGTVLNIETMDVFSFNVSVNGGTAYCSIGSNQVFEAVNTVLGTGAAGAGGFLTLDGGQLFLAQWLTLGNDGTDSGTFILNDGELTARFGIRAGNTAPPASSLFIFNEGRISSANIAAEFKGFDPSLLEIQLAGTGIHEFYAAAGASITVHSSARLVDKPGEQGTLLKTGPAELFLNASGTYSGGTTVREGTLAIHADGGLGGGDVWVEAATLSLTGGTADDYIADDATLVVQELVSGLFLDFEGTDTVSAVSLDGGASWLAVGVYDATELDIMGTGLFSGSGSLNVLSTPGPVATPPNEAALWDMTSLRTNAVVMETVSSLASDGYLHDEVHFFVTNSAGTVDRFYACMSYPEQLSEPLPLFFMLHGGGGHASRAFAKVPLSNLPVGQQAISVAIDYGTTHATPEELALHTLYGDPVPQSYSTSTDVNEELLYRSMMGFRRIMDYLLEQGTVDTNQVAVFGTSWGGFRSMLWAGLDDRITVAVAAPGGGGMRDSLSNIGSQVATIPEPVRTRWYQEFDPVGHAADVQAQTFFEAPANDEWFWLAGVEKNLKTIETDSRWVVIPNDNHGLGVPNAERGWVWPYVMNALFDGKEWPQVVPESFYASGMTYEWETQTNGIDSATLWFSAGSTDLIWPSRYWTGIPAVFSAGKWSATLPDRVFEVAGTVFVSVTDTNGFRSSSLTQIRGGRDPRTEQCPLWTGGAIWDVDAGENGWRPINQIISTITAGLESGSVLITPSGAGQFAVCNNSVVLASPYASVRQGLRLRLNGNGLPGLLEVELQRNSETPGVAVYRAEVSIGAGETDLILPWSSFVAQGDATGAPYPFDGLVLRGTRSGSVPLTIESVDFHEEETSTGVPYWWLLEQGFSGDMETAAAFDADGDGVDSGGEYMASTDPLDSESVLKISLEMQLEEKALLEWYPVSMGRTYTVESSGGLPDGFSVETLPMEYPAAAYTLSVINAQGFYQVTVDYTGTVRSAGSYLPPGVSVQNPGGSGTRMVRYNEAGELVDLRAFGVNWYDAFSRYMEEETDRSFVEGFEYLAAHGIPVARVHARGYGPISWNLYFSDKAEYYRRLDDFVAEAEQHGIGLLLDLFGGLSHPGELVDDAVAAGYLIPGVDFQPASPLNQDIYGSATYAEYRTDLGREDSGSNAFIAYFTREMVSRYKSSPAIWGWEFANESNNAVDLPNIQNYRPQPDPLLGYFLQRDDSSVPAWISPDDITREHVRVAKMNFARSVRSVDSWRFISSGDSRPRPTAYNNWKYHTWQTDTRAEIVQVLPMDNPVPMDTVSMHIYQPTDPYFADSPVSIEPVTGDYEAFLDFFRQEAELLGQPLFVGEWGASGDGTTADEKTTFHRFMQALVDTEIQLSFLWNFDNRNPSQVDSFWVNPGTPKEYQLTNDDLNLWDLEQVNQLYGAW